MNKQQHKNEYTPSSMNQSRMYSPEGKGKSQSAGSNWSFKSKKERQNPTVWKSKSELVRKNHLNYIKSSLSK